MKAVLENCGNGKQHLFQDHGQTVDTTHIEVLLKEMEDMDKSYAEMASMFTIFVFILVHAWKTAGGCSSNM